MYLLNRIVVTEQTNENSTDPPPRPSGRLLWSGTCPSPQIRAWLWNDAQKGFQGQFFGRIFRGQSFHNFSPCSVSGGISVHSLFRYFHNSVFFPKSSWAVFYKIYRNEYYWNSRFLPFHLDTPILFQHEQTKALWTLVLSVCHILIFVQLTVWNVLKINRDKISVQKLTVKPFSC